MKIEEIRIIGKTLIVELDNLIAYSFNVDEIVDVTHLKKLLEDWLTAEKANEKDYSEKLKEFRDALLNTEINPRADGQGEVI